MKMGRGCGDIYEEGSGLRDVHQVCEFLKITYRRGAGVGGIL